MTVILGLVTHGPTTATRSGAFASDEPLLQEAGATPSRPAWRGRRIWTSPKIACRQTAQRLSLAAEPAAQIADLDYGRWSGMSLDDVAAIDPGAVARWIADADFKDHGGESRTDLSLRVMGWLDRVLAEGQHAVAITHATVVRAVVLGVLSAPPEAFWRIDTAPLTLTELRHDGRAWRVRFVANVLRD